MGISIWQLLIILAIVLLLFGAKRLRNIGGDLGASVKGFKQAMSDGEKKDDNKQVSEQAADAEKPAEKPAEAAGEDKKAS